MLDPPASAVGAISNAHCTERCLERRKSIAAYASYAFTEHGAIQAANVLNSPRAAEVGVYVVCAFVQLREMLAGNKELAAKLAELYRERPMSNR